MLKKPSINFKKPNYESNQTNPGQRITIPTLNNATGTLRYVGQVSDKPGIWAGIELDVQGQGKNDGTVQGKRYFSCAPNSGLFIATNKIIIHSPTPTIPSSKACKSSNTPKPLSIIKPKSKPKTITTPKTSSTPKTPTPKKTSNTPKTSFTPKKPTPRNSFTPTTTSKLSSTPKTNKRHSLNSLTQHRRSHTLRTSSLPIDDNPPPLQVDSSSDTTTASDTSTHTNEVTVYHEATHQLYDMLEKTQRERDLLQHQITTKEAAWERLVFSKESLSLQVQENETQKQQLSRDLEHTRSQVEQLQQSLVERDASIAQKQREQEQQTQDQKRLDRLEQFVRDLQQQLASTKDEQMQERRAHAGALEQMRRQVVETEQTSASLEKECDALRRAGLDAIHAYDASVIQMKQQHESTVFQKTQYIQQLESTITDLRQKQSSLFDDDEKLPFTDQRHRLEEQLELVMTELDHERNTMHSLTLELEQARLELSQQRHQSLTLEKSLVALQAALDREVHDKKRLIEEADAAFELQAKAEDELYQLKLTKNAQDQTFHQLMVEHQQLEQEYELIMVDTDAALQAKIKQLQDQHERERHNFLAEKKKVQGLSEDLAILESLVENRVLGDTDLELQLEEERSKVAYLEKQLKKKHKFCEYCDTYNDHTTEQCPDQNETF